MIAKIENHSLTLNCPGHGDDEVTFQPLIEMALFTQQELDALVVNLRAMIASGRTPLVAVFGPDMRG